MAPSPFLPYLDSGNASFTCFNRLALELRLVIWELALPGPRIVHLCQRLLREDKDPGWWKRVRSDKVIEGSPLPAPYPEADVQDTEDYGYFDVDDYETTLLANDALLERELAKERLLTRDEDYNGPMTRVAAKEVLARGIPRGHNERPNRLKGFWSESETPAVLLVCKESFTVASRFYTRAFGRTGALAQTYFDFHRDTLYVDDDFVPWTKLKVLSLGLPFFLPNLFTYEELARIQNFATCLRTQSSDTAVELSEFQRFLPNLKVLTIVSHHFTRGTDISSKTTADFQHLKYVEATTDSVTGDYRIRGFRIDHSIRKPPMPTKTFKDEDINRAKKRQPWTFRIEYKCLIPEAEERRILEQALDFEKKNNAGCWYINPRDKTDCDYYVDAEEGEDATFLADT
jgi:hypothetical protein